MSQRGLVTTAQLLGLGFSEDMIRTRVGRGELVRVRRGLYRLRRAPGDWHLTMSWRSRSRSVASCEFRAFVPIAAEPFARQTFGRLTGFPRSQPRERSRTFDAPRRRDARSLGRRRLASRCTVARRIGSRHATPGAHRTEVDGFEFHRTRHAFDADRVRQNDLVSADWTVLRFTSRSAPDEIVATVRPYLFVR